MWWKKKAAYKKPDRDYSFEDETLTISKEEAVLIFANDPRIRDRNVILTAKQLSEWLHNEHDARKKANLKWWWFFGVILVSNAINIGLNIYRICHAC